MLARGRYRRFMEEHQYGFLHPDRHRAGWAGGWWCGLIRPDPLDYPDSDAGFESRRLTIHLCFSLPATAVMPPGAVHRLWPPPPNFIYPLPVLFSILWIGTFVTGVFFPPHSQPGDNLSMEHMLPDQGPWITRKSFRSPPSSLSRNDAIAGKFRCEQQAVTPFPPPLERILEAMLFAGPRSRQF